MDFKFAGLIILIIVCNIAMADRLPNQTAENQGFTIDTVIDATGSIDSGTDMDWLVTNFGAIATGTVAADHNNWGYGTYGYPKGEVYADVKFKDSILTNGGKISENKNFDFDSRDEVRGLFNIETDTVITYASLEGSHMVGEEEYTESGTAEAKKSPDSIRCVFSTNPVWLPPFCNIVSAKSALVNVNSAQISTKGQIRAIAKTDDIPAELNYLIAVTPDANSGSDYAEGTLKTTYAGSIMEGKDTAMYLTQQGVNWMSYMYPERPWNVGDSTDWDLLLANNDYHVSGEVDIKPSATNTWKDASEVTGGIKNFQKDFKYSSGFKT